MGDHASPSNLQTRRSFLRHAGAATGAAAAAATLDVARSAHVAGSDIIKVGLIGCGGRGTGAAAQSVRAGANMRLYAMADLFRDKLDRSLAILRKQVPEKIDVSEDRCFTGFDAYKHVIECCDLVLLCTPPHFRPEHLKAAVDAGRHAFVEKPIAVDAPGVRSVWDTCQRAKEKGLAIVSGLCWRYHYGVRETMQKVLNGDFGEIVAMQTNYIVGYLWSVKRKPGWSDMEWQCRNWLYFQWLSGDHIVEQHIHSLDKMAWAMGDQYPVKAWGLGGRQVRTDPLYGNIYDHHSVVFEFANGIRAFSYCRQISGCYNDVSDHIFCTRGHVDVLKHTATYKGKRIWRYKGPKNNMYQTEHDEMVKSIMEGKPINNGEYMTKSTMMAIMGRMATYTGQLVTWEQAWNSKDELKPPAYEWGPVPIRPVAKPGITKLV